ncbi:MAG: putative transcriptional regulator [Limisphaerales bacterium]|jgi:predicted transcriptional regulator
MEMTTRDKAVSAIQDLPENADYHQIMRELSFLAGIDDARAEVKRGEAMTSSEAKEKLREWISQ